MIEVNGKVYRNLQEQVYENTIDIDELKRMYGYRGPYASTDDIENPVDLGLYLIGTNAPYAIYQYHEVTQNYTDLGLFNQRGPQGTPGQTGPQGPQGPEGEKGDPTTISVNGTTYESYMGNITLPDYPDTMAWANITGRPTKLSDFTNDKGFIDNSVDDLVHYYDKTTIDGVVEDLEEDIATKANAADIGDAALTIQENSTTLGVFTSNDKDNVTVNIKTPIYIDISDYYSLDPNTQLPATIGNLIANNVPSPGVILYRNNIGESITVSDTYYLEQYTNNAADNGKAYWFYKKMIFAAQKRVAKEGFHIWYNASADKWYIQLLEDGEYFLTSDDIKINMVGNTIWPTYQYPFSTYGDPKIVSGYANGAVTYINLQSKDGTVALMSDLPTNYVTTDTDQNITGTKLPKIEKSNIKYILLTILIIQQLL